MAKTNAKQQMTIEGRIQSGAFVRKAKTAAAAVPPHQYEYRTLTKDQAKALLAKVSNQRRIDQAWVLALTRTMDSGLWDCRAGRTPIALDKSDRPQNGQHRLAAFIASKLDEITFVFVTGCEPEDIESFDGDTKTRSSALSDFANAQREFARVKALDKLVSGVVRAKYTRTVVGQLRNKWKKQCEWAGETIPRHGAQGRAPYAAAFMYAWKADSEFADTHAKAWSNGGGGLPQVMLRLRDRALSGNEKTSGSTGAAAAIRTTLKMLNVLAHMHQGHEVKSAGDGLNGLRYFSGLIQDGAARRWEQGEHLLSEE